MSDNDWIELKAYEEMRELYKEAIIDRDRWRSLAMRAYKETFSVDSTHDDPAVWIDMEEAYEESSE